LIFSFDYDEQDGMDGKSERQAAEWDSAQPHNTESTQDAGGEQ